MFIPRKYQQPMPRFSGQRATWCQWCCERGARKDLFAVKDGPIDWYFCDASHYGDWLKYRVCWPVSDVLKMTPAERAERLGGKTTSQYVSELRENGIIEDCDNPFDGVRYVHNGNLSLPEATQLPS